MPCLSCSAELPAGARFCPACGTPRAAGSEATSAAGGADDSGENRQLTVMFCDLVGSSELAQRLEAEDYLECLRRYQGACATTVERFGGYVAQLLGDGALVYFGYPQANENDAERAVLAGLDLLAAVAEVSEKLSESMGVELAVRIGVHTGPVVVGALGSGARRETLALGDTTNIAARVEAQAERNTFVMTQSTMRLVDGLFQTRDLGTPVLKGIAVPVRLYEVTGRAGARSRSAVARHLSPMVDRTTESAALWLAWDEAIGGQARTVSIGGEPGLGKSRLVSQLRRRMTGAHHHWLTLQCTPFTSAGALHPWIDHLKDSFGLEGDVDPAESLSRLRRGLARLGTGSDETAQRFARLLAIPLPAGSPIAAEAVELVRHRALEALVTWVEALAREHPLVLLVEDLHWSDPSTIEWIRILIERTAKSRILCLLTHRPEFLPPWRATSLQEITLPKLGAADAGTLVQSAVVGEPLPSDLIDTIVQRADGVPLFLEELAKMVSESRGTNPGSTFEVPATLRDLLMARLDRLGPAKSLAQVGAVIGRDFSHELLCELAGGDTPDLRGNVERLVRSGLVFRSGTAPEAVYTFKHALVQDTAYESLLRRHRHALHRAAAAVLAERVESSIDVSPALLGHHWRGAGEWLKAAEHFDAAGRRAAGSAAFEEAISHFREGLANAARAPESHERKTRELSLHIMLGNALMSVKGFQSPECIEVWLRAEALAEAVDNPDELSSARNGAAVYHLTNGNLDEAERYAQSVLEVGPQGDARISGIRGHMSLATSLYFRGAGQEAYERAERSIALYQPSDFWTVTYGANLDQGVGAYAMSAMTLGWLGRLDDALSRAEAGLALAIELASPLSVAFARSTVWIVSVDRGDTDRLRVEAEEIEKLSTELSLPLWQGFAKLAEGYLGAREGDPEGIPRMMEGVAIQGEMLGPSGATMGMCLLATAQLGVDDHGAAEDLVDAGLALVESQGIPYYEDQLWILKAEIALARDPTATEAAHELLTRARSAARERGAKLFEVRAAIGLARLLQAAEDHSTAHALLLESTEGFQGEATTDGRAARGLLAELSQAG